MVYYSSNAPSPASVAGGPQSYVNPYVSSCGCGSGAKATCGMQRREGFRGPVERMGMPQRLPQVALQAPSCTLTATAPPAGCCHPAPLHCDCCNGSGFFRASEAYGS